MAAVLLLVLGAAEAWAENWTAAVIMVRASRAHRFDLRHMGPAIELGAENCSLALHYGEYDADRCSPELALGRATDIGCGHVDTDGVVAFVGPACSEDLSVVGRYAAYRTIPLLTGLGDVMEGREDFRTIIRTSYDVHDKARAIYRFMRSLGWSRFGLMVREGDVYYGTLARWLESFGEILCARRYKRNENKTIVTDLYHLVTYMRDCSRIIVILGGEKDVRQVMMIAQELDMTNTGEYAFLYPELFQSLASGNYSWASGNEPEKIKLRLKEAYSSLLIVSLHQNFESPMYRQFSKKVKDRALKNYGFKYDEDVVNYFTASFHDAMLLLCQGIRTLEERSLDPLNGTLLIDVLKNTSFEGVSGQVTINEVGDRVAEYALLDQVDEDLGYFSVVQVYSGVADKVQAIRPIIWPRGIKALDIPPCGFDGKKCPRRAFPTLQIVLGAVVVFLLLTLLGGIFVYRKLKLEAALANMSWEVQWEEIHFPKTSRNSWLLSRASLSTIGSYTDALNETTQKKDITTAIFKGTTVALKRLPCQKRIEMVRPVLMEIKMMREAQHPNLARFIGLCIDPPNMAILTEFCPKGSLQEVLQNESLKLDWVFKYSLISDIIKGMCYLHGSDLKIHGRLSSLNCVVDSHFVLKLTDFGLPSFRRHSSPSRQKSKKALWRAPELLRSMEETGTQKGDVYSFGIILQEIIMREEPFFPYCDLLDHLDIIQKIIKGERPPFRPQIEPGACSIELLQLVERCWAEEPWERPDFITIRTEMKAIVKGEHGDVNIMDNLLTRMEQYANNLEVLVDQRTEAFLEEKRRSEELLYQVLPRSVAEQLKQGKSVQPELFQNVTIYFSDIVGFTALCSVSTPMQVVDFLNDLYTCFDGIVSDYDAYKVETIGDAYMVVSGLPDRNGLRHAPEIARLALALLRASRQFCIRHRPQDRLRVRIGIHTGPCCAGVVGRKMPRYCLFGDTVNTASRMESTGEPLRIHISHTTYEILKDIDGFILERRGEVDIKGKGKMETYWLCEESSPSPIVLWEKKV